MGSTLAQDLRLSFLFLFPAVNLPGGLRLEIIFRDPAVNPNEGCGNPNSNEMQNPAPERGV